MQYLTRISGWWVDGGGSGCLCCGHVTLCQPVYLQYFSLSIFQVDLSPGLAITWMSPTQTHCNSPVTSPDPFWAHCAYGKQHRCQEDLVNSPSGGLEETLRTPPHHMAEHRTAGSEIPQSHTAWSNEYGPESVEDVVNIWHYAILSCMPETMMPPSNIQAV